MYEPFSRQVKGGNWKACKEKKLVHVPTVVKCTVLLSATVL